MLTMLEKFFIKGLMLANKYDALDFNKTWEEQDANESLMNGYDYADFVMDNKLEKCIGMKMTQARGVISSLVKKGIVEHWDAKEYGYAYDMIVFHKEGFDKIKAELI